MKVQAQSSWESPPEYNVGYDLLNQLKTYINIMLFQISSKENKGSESSLKFVFNMNLTPNSPEIIRNP